MASKTKMTRQKEFTEMEQREEPEEEPESESGELLEVQQKVPAKSETKEPTERTDDPVRMYLREMRSVELLSREGEIADGFGGLRGSEANRNCTSFITAATTAISR
jgi:hypothetical protein